MDFYANEGKNVIIEAGGKKYARHAIATHFVQVGESYIDLIEKYVKPVYQPGDILSSSEKVIALCQGRIAFGPRSCPASSIRPPPAPAWGFR